MDQSAYFAQMRQKRKAEILSFARNMFLNQGISAFNIQQLARGLDISTVTLYKYFKNSDDILYALQKQILQDLDLHPLALSFPEHEDTLHSIRILFQNFYKEILKRREDLSLLLLSKLHINAPSRQEDPDEILLVYTAFLIPDLDSLLKKAQSEGLLKSDVPLSVILNFLTQMNLTMLEHIALIRKRDSQKDSALKQQIEQFIAFLIASIAN